MLGMGLVSGGNKAVIWNGEKDEVRCCSDVHQTLRAARTRPNHCRSEGMGKCDSTRVGRVE